MAFWNNIYSIGIIGTALTFTGIGITIYMAMRGRNNRIKLTVDLNSQSEELNDGSYARRAKTYRSDQLMTRLYDDALTLYDVIRRGSKESVDGQCLGKYNKSTGQTDWLSYKEVLERITHCGDGLLKLGLKQGKNTFVGIYSSNCIEYVIIEYGCYNHSMVVVPLYDTLGPNVCRHIINQTEISCVVCDKFERVEAIMSQANNMTTLKHIIVTGDIPQSYKSKALSYGIKVVTLKEVENLGQPYPVKHLIPQPKDLAVVCYTSGTTDLPKGVMLSHENIVANFSGVLHQLGEYAPNKHDVYMSYLPLAHMFERCCEAAVFMVGAKVAFFNGDIKNLSEDMKKIKPTVIPVVPRILSRIHDKVYSTVKGNKLKEWLLRRAISSKKDEINRQIIRNNGFWDKLVFKSVRENLGGKLRLMVCGSAPLAGNILDFSRCALGCMVVEGFGQTECVCPCTLTIPGDCQSGNVGPPLPSCHIKLVDVPEMNYYAIDGKGEVCVSGPIVFQGYYGEPEKTQSVVDDDGYLHTGDIGQWLSNGTLRIIDRKKHIFKLSQGEYIAPEKIESIYSRSTFVAQIFIYGESLKSSLIAVVVPDQEVLEAWCRKNNVRGPYRDLCQNRQVKTTILNDLLSLGKKDGLHSFEQIKDIYVHPEPFSIDNGLLTPTLKTKRIEVRKFFASQLEDMYRSLD